MAKDINQDQLISHNVLTEEINTISQNISARIIQFGDKPYVTVERQLELLDQLQQFDFGRFLLQNQGINGYWTHYMLTHPWFGRKTGKNNRGQPLSTLEEFLLDRAPIMLATQQRFEFFLKENQKQVSNDAKLACIPCGMMGELLYLDFKPIERIQLIGIDYDPEALNDARSLAEKKKLAHYLQLNQGNAWQLSSENEFDLISSNGLTIYEQDDEKVTALFRQFYSALKPGGKLVASFLTPPPSFTDQCEWNMSHINQNDLLLQKIILVDIIQAKFQFYRSTQQTRQQLESIGYKNIQFIYDDAKIFPTVVAYKQV